MPRAGLTRAAVVAAAVEAVDGGGAKGFEDLTLASIAATAGVAVPSLYKHVSSLADLRREVSIVSMNSLTAAITDATTGRAGPDAVRAMAHAMRDFALESPGRYNAAQVAPDFSDPADAEVVAAAALTIAVPTAVLRGFDLPADRTVDAIRVLRAAIHGFVVLEVGGGFRLPNSLDRSFDVLVEAIVAGIRGLVPTATRPEYP
jgi:AcrR family transcriptional regulator